MSVNDTFLEYGIIARTISGWKAFDQPVTIAMINWTYTAADAPNPYGECLEREALLVRTTHIPHFSSTGGESAQGTVFLDIRSGTWVH